VIPLPTWIEQPDPGGVSWTTRTSSLIGLPKSRWKSAISA
jgi:hypothetical protein